MKNLKILVLVGIILLVLLLWGAMGSVQASEIGTTCDLGITGGDKGEYVLCWKWHRNIVGDVQDKFNEVLGK